MFVRELPVRVGQEDVLGIRSAAKFRPLVFGGQDEGKEETADKRSVHLVYLTCYCGRIKLQMFNHGKLEKQIMYLLNWFRQFLSSSII